MTCRVVVQARLPLSAVVVIADDKPAVTLQARLPLSAVVVIADDKPAVTLQARLPLSAVVVRTRATQSVLGTEDDDVIVTEGGDALVIEVCYGH